MTAVLELPVLSNSRVKTYTRCKKAYEFKYVMGLKRKKRVIQLERGSWLHELLMVHYDGHDWRERHAELSEEFYELFEEEREELGDLPAECERLMRNYLHFHQEEDAQHTTIDTELDEILTLPNGLRFRFIIDRIFEDERGRLWLKDYKTVKKFMPGDFMLLDAQLTRYFWCAEHMGYKPLAGVIFDEIITFPPTLPKLVRNDTALERRKNIRCDYYTYATEIKRRGFKFEDYGSMLRLLKARRENWFRRTKLPRDQPVTRQMMQELVMHARSMMDTDRRAEYPRTPMKDCVWSCDYLEPCTVQLQGGDISSILRSNYVRDRREE